MSSQAPHRPALPLALLLALGAPALLAYNAPPSATTLNQLMAMAGWGTVVVAAGLHEASPWTSRPHPAVLWVLGLLVAAVAGSWMQGLPASLALSHAGVLLGALLVFVTASWVSDSEGQLGHAFASALVTVAAVNVVIAVLQVFLPNQLDGSLVAHSVMPGRAIGNLRQPNHLSTLLLWGLIALVPLAEAGRWFRWRLDPGAALALGAALVFAVVLTASRTGAVGMALLALWGLADRRLPKSIRMALLATPVLFAACWWGMGWWAQATDHLFIGPSRLEAADPSSSRFGIWSNTLALIAANPWTGVGWGEFNFAWTLSVFPKRPVAHFDHTHNLPLQFAVELGIPAALLLMGLLLWSLVSAGQRAWRCLGPAGPVARACVVMVVMIGVHSLLEYPLWYAYFLYPTVWALGTALSARGKAPDETEQAALPPPSDGLSQVPSLTRLAGVLLLLGASASFMDYGRVMRIFSTSALDVPLGQRVEQGMRSVFHAHHAFYAEATLSQEPALVTRAFQEATHALIDSRLLLAWARAYEGRGDRDKARYLVDRIREFRNPEMDGLFAVCQDAPASGPDRPFQCDPAQGAYTWRDFMR